MPQSYYIDACVLISYFDEQKKDQNKIAKDTIHKIINTVERNPEISVKIPTLVLGEIYLWVLRHDQPELIFDFGRLFNQLNADFPAPTREHYALAARLLEEDEYLENHDALIVSHPILDNDTTWFFTHESKLHNNMVIEQEKDERDNRFMISDRF
ncbi:hypothetical protein DRP07_06705 [Archaeoglobales archaeon]|nr:MAG: hypothetical protein DRP07_06705 [Archaeoglobales archaeon]